MRNLRYPEASTEVMELAELLTDLAEVLTGRQDGCFEEYQRRFHDQGINGLKDLQLGKKLRPRVTSGENVAAIINLSVEHPGWGCVRLSRALRERGTAISPPTVQSILNKNNLRDAIERTMQLEERAMLEKRELSAEQIAMIERINPCFRERLHKSTRPGEMLVQDTLYVGKFKGCGKVYLQMIVDTFNCYAFCQLHAGKFADYAVALLYHQVVPFYRKQGLTLGSILTDNGREYCGKEQQHHFELYLRLNGIEHRYLPVRQSQTNGYGQRFRRTVFYEFFLPGLQANKYSALKDFQAALDRWLIDYNTRKPLRGYPNFSKTPEEMLTAFMKPSQEAEG